MKTILAMYITLMPVIFMGIFNMIFCKLKIFQFLNVPLDNKKVLKDGKRLFGDNKTWKGFLGYLVIGLITTVIWGLICREYHLTNYFYSNHDNTMLFNSLLGLLLGFTYSLCELPNSFIKRRFDIQEGKMSHSKLKIIFFIYDQVDSIIGCCLIVALFYKMSFSFYLLCVGLGGLTHVVVNILLYLLKIRKNMF